MAGQFEMEQAVQNARAQVQGAIRVEQAREALMAAQAAVSAIPVIYGHAEIIRANDAIGKARTEVLAIERRTGVTQEGG